MDTINSEVIADLADNAVAHINSILLYGKFDGTETNGEDVSALRVHTAVLGSITAILNPEYAQSAQALINDLGEYDVNSIVLTSETFKRFLA